jgi:hypothetical protein
MSATHHKKAHEPTDSELKQEFEESLSKEIDKQQSDAVVAAGNQPIDCPPTGGATSSHQMNSTVALVCTDYQYWNMKMHGHHPGGTA